ncbi:L-type lectin-domain containing receptor kinase S.1 [Raphanus sativus]|uniref:non-specific serine/threonine protein kinase n=1 Tax=Raphanus sativus TaxID=3726 RepID=A0A6J0K3H2_RAPSA|nr:L-type lectin-domain containing receptor kinase S.1 [Raphanus sativus]KAJ4890017.1 L-type lectin-domain containing receptor kinase S.1 [Raphanus sativus]
MWRQRQWSPPLLLFILTVATLLPSSSSIDFLYNNFTSAANTTDLILIEDSRVESTVVLFINETEQYSLGRVFYPQKLSIIPDPTGNPTRLSSFSTSFVFSILPDISSSPGFGLCFVLCNSTSPPGAIASQNFGLFPDIPSRVPAPLIAVEFDTGLNGEANDIDGNHIGIDLNTILSTKAETAGYYNSSANGSFVPVNMRNGQNIHAWIDFDGPNFEINVTIAPAGMPRPPRPTLTYRDPVIANYVSADMFVGFSASKTLWVEVRRILAWSLSDTGAPPREINTTGLPVFFLDSPSSSLSTGAIAGIVIGCVVFLCLLGLGGYFLWWKLIREEEEEEAEEWELEFWPHRFTYEDLSAATDSFSSDRLLGSGGFGKVYRGILSNNSNEVAVKCVNHDSKQGLREFMAEIESMGRLQHKNLVQMRGWCRRKSELMLVYDYMPNGSLNQWIFDHPKEPMTWRMRRQVINDVAEGLNYLHHGWEQVVIHRDIKSSNILLDSDMRGRLGDFGLAKLYEHGGAPNTTRVVGTLGYLAPELASASSPTEASDVYSFGVVVLEVVCGRRPIQYGEEEDMVLVDWVRDLYGQGVVVNAADERVRTECDTDDEIELLLKLGLACCHPDPAKRPTMREIVSLLIGSPQEDLLTGLTPVAVDTASPSIHA